MIIHPSTWKQFIMSHHAAAAMNSAFPTLRTLFDHDKSIMDCTNAALGIEPSLFLICPAATGKPTIVHQFSKAFRNALIENDNEEFFCLLGWGDNASPIKFETASFFAIPGDGSMTNGGNRRSDFPGLDITVLRAAGNVEDFARATETRPRIHLRKCVAIPPFIANWLLSTQSDDPHAWGTKIAIEIRSIEQENDNPLHGVITSDQGKTAIDRILGWLFFVKYNNNLHVECSPVFPGSKIDNLAKGLHQVHLVRQNALTNQPTREDRVSDAMERTAAMLQEMSDNRRTENENASSTEKGFNKLPLDIQQFLLAIGSHDLEHPADSIPQSGLDLLKLNQKNAATSLSRLLKKQGKRYVNLNIAQLNEITSINWFSSTNPFTGLSLCRIPPIANGLLSSTQEKDSEDGIAPETRN
jgi:hypothetical protein